jgi:hypothetical protein
MKKIILLLILLIAILYASTERYLVVVRNLSRDGWSAIIEEPFWVGQWISKQLGIAKDDINSAIDGKTLGRDPNIR